MERLSLRKLKETDVEAIYNNWASDPEVTKYLTWCTHENIDVTKTIVDMWLKEESNPKTIRFIITEKGSDEAIGSIDVVNYHEGQPEVGYCLSRKHWNKGYMTEVVKEFIKILFDKGFHTIYICANENNISSNRVIEKCGFVFAHKEARDKTSIFKPEPVTVNWYKINK